MHINIFSHHNLPALVDTTPIQGQRTARRHRQRARIEKLQDQERSALRRLAVSSLSSILAAQITRDRESA